jgi:hypothetical protein
VWQINAFLSCGFLQHIHRIVYPARASSEEYAQPHPCLSFETKLVTLFLFGNGVRGQAGQTVDGRPRILKQNVYVYQNPPSLALLASFGRSTGMSQGPIRRSHGDLVLDHLLHRLSTVSATSWEQWSLFHSLHVGDNLGWSGSSPKGRRPPCQASGGMVFHRSAALGRGDPKRLCLGGASFLMASCMIGLSYIPPCFVFPARNPPARGGYTRGNILVSRPPPVAPPTDLYA